MGFNIGNIPLSKQSGMMLGMEDANALARSLMENKIKQSQADYAPYTNYANAKSKIAYANLTPYQIQAQVMSNPMVWAGIQQLQKDNPDAAKNMINNLMKSIPTIDQMRGNDLPPPPNNNVNSNSLLGMLGSIFGMGKGNQGDNSVQSGNAINTVPDISSNNLNPNDNGATPLTENTSDNSSLAPGGIGGIVNSKTAPFNEQPFKPGSTARVNNTEVSIPTGSTVTDIQSSINAVKRVTPKIERLADEAADFMTIKGNAKLFGQRIGNLFESKQFGGELPSKYANFKANLKTVPESLVKAYGLNPTNETLDRMQGVVEPYIGETKDGYKNRVLNELENIKKEQVGVGSEQLRAGFPLNDNGNTKANNVENVPEKPVKIKQVVKNLPVEKVFDLTRFKDDADFNKWYSAQSKASQRQIQKQLSAGVY
jgi:hypothetical protein